MRREIELLPREILEQIGQTVYLDQALIDMRIQHLVQKYKVPAGYVVEVRATYHDSDPYAPLQAGTEMVIVWDDGAPDPPSSRCEHKAQLQEAERLRRLAALEVLMDRPEAAKDYQQRAALLEEDVWQAIRAKMYPS